MSNKVQKTLENWNKDIQKSNDPLDKVECCFNIVADVDRALD